LCCRISEQMLCDLKHKRQHFLDIEAAVGDPAQLDAIADHHQHGGGAVESGQRIDSAARPCGLQQFHQPPFDVGLEVVKQLCDRGIAAALGHDLDAEIHFLGAVFDHVNP